MNITRAQAEMYRKLIVQASDSLNDTDAAYVPRIFELWEPDKYYEVGKRLCYRDKLYKVLIAHTSQGTWTPDVSPSLFAEILIPNPHEIPEWVQPGSTNAYMTGDKVRHNNKVWISTVDYNVWEPGVYGWDEVV